MKANRLAGHSLPSEGRIGFWGTENGEGFTVCSCGLRSPLLPNTAKRRAWHAAHKDEVRAKGVE